MFQDRTRWRVLTQPVFASCTNLHAEKSSHVRDVDNRELSVEIHAAQALQAAAVGEAEPVVRHGDAELGARARPMLASIAGKSVCLPVAIAPMVEAPKKKRGFWSRVFGTGKPEDEK